MVYARRVDVNSLVSVKNLALEHKNNPRGLFFICFYSLATEYLTVKMTPLSATVKYFLANQQKLTP